MNANKLLRLKALQTSLGRILAGSVFPTQNQKNRGFKKAPLYTHGQTSMANFEKSATYKRMNQLNNEIKELKNVGTIVSRINAKRKQYNAHANTGSRTSSLRTFNWVKKQEKLADELRNLHDKLLVGVRALNKIKARKAAAGARGRNFGLALKQSFNYRPPAPGIGNFGGSEYRKLKRNFNMMTGKIVNTGTSPRRNASPKSVSPKRGMRHAGV
jgi:hypothetical protein